MSLSCQPICGAGRAWVIWRQTDSWVSLSRQLSVSAAWARRGAPLARNRQWGVAFSPGHPRDRPRHWTDQRQRALAHPMGRAARTPLRSAGGEGRRGDVVSRWSADLPSQNPESIDGDWNRAGTGLRVAAIETRSQAVLRRATSASPFRPQRSERWWTRRAGPTAGRPGSSGGPLVTCGDVTSCRRHTRWPNREKCASTGRSGLGRPGNLWP